MVLLSWLFELFLGLRPIFARNRRVNEVKNPLSKVFIFVVKPKEHMIRIAAEAITTIKPIRIFVGISALYLLIVEQLRLSWF